MSRSSFDDGPDAIAAGVSSLSLARRILSHLVALDLPKGAHVGEQALANAMGLSRTPVRKALAVLCHEGLLRRVENRGYFLEVPASVLFAASKDLPGGDDDLFVRIGLDHLDGRLSLPLTEAGVAEHYGVAQRHAQRILENLREEGVIIAADEGGWRFNAFLLEPDASRASYAFRRAIEPQIPKLATFKVDRAQLRHCRDEHIRFLALPSAQRTSRIAFAVDAAFHEMVARFGNNPFFHSGVVQHNRLRRLLEYRDSFDEERITVWLREHLDIVEALADEDADAASTLLGRHLARAEASREATLSGR